MRVNRDIEGVTAWFARHGLVVNPRKSLCSIFGHVRLLANISIAEVPKLLINNEYLEYKKEIKCLGIVLQDTLSWSTQTNIISRKIRSQLYVFDKLLIYKSLNVKKTLFLMPHLLYGLSAMCDMDYQCKQTLQRSLNSVIRFVLNLKFDDRIYDKFKKLNILKIEDLIQVSILTSMHRIINIQKPMYLAGRFIKFSHVHDVNTRNREFNFLLPICRTQAFHNSFLCKAILYFNGLPADLKVMQNYQTFKINLKKYLISKY